THLLGELRRAAAAGSGADPADLLRERVAAAIHAGRLQPLDRLPSIRAAAQALGIEKHAMVRAYDALEEVGLVEKRERSGVFVLPMQQAYEEPLGETAHWLAGVLAGACDHQIRIPHLPDLLRRSTAAARLRCACVESDLDSQAELRREAAHQFGLDAYALSEPLRDPAAGVPEALREADVLVTTAFHAHELRPVAERLDKPLVVARLRPERVAAIEEHLRRRPLTVVCTDPAYGERIRRLFGGARPERVRVVLAGEARALAALDPAVPVLMTRAARQRPTTGHLRMVVPFSPAFASEFARTLSSLVIRLNVKRGHGPG
ncbi:MAG TPA: GntR family transcriptional regulator, partial [Longimicrobiaceae bacterium]|nr:GntR family transcriptional regulator [Longimicrobiaceae bacterium]